MKRNQQLILGAVATTMLFTGAAQAAVLLTTDFSSPPATTSGSTLSNIAWTETGLTAPTSLTASAGSVGNTGVRDGHFASAINIGQGNSWTVTVSVTTGASAVILKNIVADMTNFEGSITETRFFQRAPRGQQISAAISQGGTGLAGGTATFTSTPFDSEQLDTDIGDPSVDHVLTFASPLVLSANTTYDVLFTIDEDNAAGGGNQSGFDNLTFNSIPEPSTTALLGLGGLALILRRRSCTSF